METQKVHHKHQHLLFKLKAITVYQARGTVKVSRHSQGQI